MKCGKGEWDGRKRKRRQNVDGRNEAFALSLPHGSSKKGAKEESDGFPRPANSLLEPSFSQLHHALETFQAC